jgi:hypothetical protein
MDITKTARGFSCLTFADRNGEACSLQESSLATEPAIWLGVDDARPMILASTLRSDLTGWVNFPIPDDVSFTTRMHLTQDQVAALLPYLHQFVETGELA